MAGRPNGKFLVTPDPRRGKIAMEKTADGVMHFRWYDRTTNQLEDDRMVFPDDVEFKRVKTGRENDRVFMLKFVGRTERIMFWMQNKSSEKDEENCAKVNQYANNPNAAGKIAIPSVHHMVISFFVLTPTEAATASPGQDAWRQMMG